MVSRWFNGSTVQWINEFSWASLRSRVESSRVKAKQGQARPGGLSIKSRSRTGWRDSHHVDGGMFAHFSKLLDLYGGQHGIW